MDSGLNFPLFVLTTSAILLTPGPTNTLLALAGLNQGRLKATRLVAFELMGYTLNISAWGFFLAVAQDQFPWVGTAVRAASCVFLAYIAVKMWRSSNPIQTSGPADVTPRMLFLATLLNTKGLVFASVVFPGRAFDEWHVYLGHIVTFSFLVVPIGCLWVVLGAGLARGSVAGLSPFRLRRLGAVTIGAFSVSLAWVTFGAA